MPNGPWELGLIVTVRLLITQIGFGTRTKWYKEDGQGSLNQDLIQVLKAAIWSGSTHTDTAEAEKEVDIAIKESNIPRKELFVTTKVLDCVGDTDSAINNSPRKLQLDYVDLYQTLSLLPFPHLMKNKSDLTTGRYMIHSPY